MQPSAIEKEFTRIIFGLRTWLRRHDRAVIIGLMMSIIPLPPVTVAGILLGLANLMLLKTGKLDRSEKKIIRNGLVFGVLILLLGLVFWYHLYHATTSFHWNVLIDSVTEGIVDFFNFIKRLLNFNDQTGHGHTDII